MKKEEAYLLGKIIRTHGVKGDVMIFLDADDPGHYKKLKNLFIERDEELMPFNVSRVSIQDNIARLHLEGIEDMTAAEGLLKSNVYMPLTFLPELGDKRFYFHEVINFKVVDKEKGEIGIFEKVIESSHQTIGQIKNGNKEILVPLIKEFIDHIDRKEKTLYLNLPEGLVDLYLDISGSSKEDF